MPIDELRQLALGACLACGGSPAMAKALVDVTLSAACFGRTELGFPHFVDYLTSLRDGRINGDAKPRFDHVLPALIQADADGGIAQLGFDLIYDDFTTRVKPSAYPSSHKETAIPPGNWDTTSGVSLRTG
ncbi:LDH2 family malate/lactate/ureidoglycolate dehydrogenase [Rhizobium laguerreae]|uniref:LDH2 family malate/lactate/ureidoglycolate dehydrogenase n=1 Tax=Rhizobium laguerreae TaxID=1076926 RepID=A0ABR6GC71_9HYPH|nr:LDH2 family malate/lactate/ureidoglycolate dehydrogenase [Rhizobium laguerreae]